MRSYNVVGYTLFVAYALVAMRFAPPELGPGWGLLVGLAYLLVIWFLGGVYLSDILHLGIAHGALDFKPWFVKAVTVLNNTAGIYVAPTAWVNRHRHHHEFSDRDGDPNKRDGDGFWKTLYLCLVPYPCTSNLADDAIHASATFRVIATPWFAALSQVSSYALLLLVVRDWAYALALWTGVRLFGLWVNMIQNFWTHDRRFGSRRYDDPMDNAMNIGDWLPVTATFGACLQNNHHHYPYLARTSHDSAEYDFGVLTVRAFRALGLVTTSPTGRELPKDLPLAELGL